jgi:amino acid transporter
MNMQQKTFVLIAAAATTVVVIVVVGVTSDDITYLTLMNTLTSYLIPYFIMATAGQMCKTASKTPKLEFQGRCQASQQVFKSSSVLGLYGEKTPDKNILIPTIQ